MAEAREGIASDGGDGDRRPPLAEDVTELLAGLDTGDLILFDRPCLKMGGFFGAAICAAAKLMSGSPFDHIGVVVKDETGINTMVEASFSGVAVRPLCERVRRSSASQICVRRLQANRTEGMRAEARRFVSEVVHLPYKEGGDGLLQMVTAAFRFHPAKEQRRRVHAETIALSTSIASLEGELAAQPETARDDALQACKKERLRRAITRRRKALVFLASAAGSTPGDAAAPPLPPSGTPAAAEEPLRTASLPSEGDSSPASSTSSLPSGLSSSTTHSSAPPSPSPLPESSTPADTPPPPPPTEYDGGLFCSELVAALYQRLGLLDAPFPASHDYVPADFAQSLGNPIELVGFDDGGGQGTDGRSGEKEKTSATAADNTTTDAEGERRRRQSDEAGETHTSPAVLEPPQPPVPEGDGRVALLRGASLSPGCWLRGGPPPRASAPPPPPPSLDGKDGTGNARDGGGGGGGGGRGLTPPAAAAAAAAYVAEGPVDKASPLGSPWPTEQDAAAVAAAGLLRLVGSLSEDKLGLPCPPPVSLAVKPNEQRRQRQRQRRRRNTVGTWWGWSLFSEPLDSGKWLPPDAWVGTTADAYFLSGGGGHNVPRYGPTVTLSRPRLQHPTTPPPETTRVWSNLSVEPRIGSRRNDLPAPFSRFCLPGTRKHAEGLASRAEENKGVWRPASAAAFPASRKASVSADADDGARGGFEGDEHTSRPPHTTSALFLPIAIVAASAAAAAAATAVGAAALVRSKTTKAVLIGERPRLGVSGGSRVMVATKLGVATAAAAAAAAAVVTTYFSASTGSLSFPRRKAGLA